MSATLVLLVIFVVKFVVFYLAYMAILMKMPGTMTDTASPGIAFAKNLVSLVEIYGIPIILLWIYGMIDAYWYGLKRESISDQPNLKKNFGGTRPSRTSTPSKESKAILSAIPLDEEKPPKQPSDRTTR